jgi:hypothetical protein
LPGKGCSSTLVRVRILGCILFAAVTLVHAYAIAQNYPEGDRLLILRAGTLPVILSAPHGGREPIPGIVPRRRIGVAQFTVERDSNTAELTEILAVKLRVRFGATPFPVIARFERKFVDANRDPATAYETLQAKPYYESYHRAIRESAETIR